MRRQFDYNSEMDFFTRIKDEKFVFDQGEDAGIFVRHWVLELSKPMLYEEFTKLPHKRQSAIKLVLMAHDRVVT